MKRIIFDAGKYICLQSFNLENCFAEIKNS